MPKIFPPSRPISECINALWNTTSHERNEYNFQNHFKQDQVAKISFYMRVRHSEEDSLALATLIIFGEEDVQNRHDIVRRVAHDRLHSRSDPMPWTEYLCKIMFLKIRYSCNDSRWLPYEYMGDGYVAGYTN